MSFLLYGLQNLLFNYFDIVDSQGPMPSKRKMRSLRTDAAKKVYCRFPETDTAFNVLITNVSITCVQIKFI